MTKKIRLLFFAHAVTTAHFSRPLKWIEGLDVDSFDIYLGSHEKFEGLAPKNGVTFISTNCIDAAKFEKIVLQAKPIYDAATYEKHIAEDIRLIETIKPDVVIGDFRHSLTVSCRTTNTPYINLTNAYWHPRIALPFPLPETPLVRILGERPASLLLGPFLPIALRINFFFMAFVLRKSFKSVGRQFVDYRQVITDGDLTLFCDTPELVPIKSLHSHERYIGPLIWSMPIGVPVWWKDLNSNKKRILITLGSSGPADRLPMIVKALASLDVELVVALAGKKAKLPVGGNVFVADFLPIEAACRDADLVICNGGSPLIHSALTFGVPTIGIVCNNDQLLNMIHIQHRRAGVMLRYWNLTEKRLTDTVNEVLGNPLYREKSKEIRAEFETIDVRNRLQNSIREVLDLRN